MHRRRLPALGETEIRPPNRTRQQQHPARRYRDLSAKPHALAATPSTRRYPDLPAKPHVPAATSGTALPRSTRETACTSNNTQHPALPRSTRETARSTATPSTLRYPAIPAKPHAPATTPGPGVAEIYPRNRTPQQNPAPGATQIYPRNRTLNSNSQRCALPRYIRETRLPRQQHPALGDTEIYPRTTCASTTQPLAIPGSVRKTACAGGNFQRSAVPRPQLAK